MKIEDSIHQPKFSSATQKAIINLMYTASWLSNEIEQVMKPFGISSQQFNIMRILRGQGSRPVSLKLVTGRMIDHMSNTSRLVDKLVAKGYVRRETAECDRRQLEISLTDSGRVLLEKMSIRVDEVNHILFDHMVEDKLVTLNGILDELREKEI
ncbi:MAG: MarR family transcriptional regulator [Bacteroidetes bacterium]|nr:MAG: MarR family transcriptional regulator [Bacteroidota bacterium]